MGTLDSLLNDTPINEGFTLTKDSFPKGLVDSVHPTGSRYICNPPVMTTDEDYFVLSRKKEALVRHLEATDWEHCLDQHYGDSKFIAMRKEELNIIILFNGDEFVKSVQATLLAKRFNLVNKKDRVDLFELVRNGIYNDSGEYLETCQ